MIRISMRSPSLVVATLGLLAGAILWSGDPAGAQSDVTGATADGSDRNSPSYTRSMDVHVAVQPDMTSIVDSTVRLKVLRESAIRTLGQQNLSYVKSLGRLEIIKAYTEKADGTIVEVDEANILSRDAATGLNAIYQRDAKVKTIIFPDIEVGDTLVWVSRTNRIDKRFGGHFFFDTVFSRSVPFATYRLTVDEPASVRLAASIRGEGLTYEVTKSNAGRQHKFTFRPGGWGQDEPNAISFLDRDPRIVLTTYKDWSEVGASYWASMKDRDVVDPGIRNLAEEITKGIVDKRAQATAIDYWVKRNIRYVLVFLGSGGTTPNPPLTVLKNKFGDCKDHVTLMGALLRAKGIASEQVLINDGPIYGQPELPVPSFNHVILYLPEFDLYTDPTASYAAFATLPLGSHDKPVLHISSAGSRPARTPAMAPDDHVTIAKTTATIGADGSVKGTTLQTSTGVFAVSSRSVAARMQNQGREGFAETVLRNLGSPGTGFFEVAAPFNYAEPYEVSGEFSLSQKLQMPLSGARTIPIGMPILWRPGLGLLGSRINGRKTDFICFAGKQVEEIELKFAAGLPMPRAIPATSIDNDYFSYQARFVVKDQTLMIQHEFTSKVKGQVCARDLEAELAEPFERVSRSIQARMVFGPAVADVTVAQPR